MTLSASRTRRLITAVAPAVVLAAGLASAPAAPAGATTLPTRDQWLSDVSTALDGSASYLQDRIATGGGPMAINLDIDNTSLQTYYARGQAVPQTLQLAQYAHAHGVKVFFNTGRSSGLRKIARQLRRAGFPVDRVCGRRPGMTLSAGKQRCREIFVSRGYTIIANIGNRSTDLDGIQDFEKGYKLPDYGNQLA